MWNDFKSIIFRLFGSRTGDKSFARDVSDVRAFTDVSRENLTAVFANSLAAISFADSSVCVSSRFGRENPRSAYLNAMAQKYWSDVKRIVSIGNGCGMIATIPYVAGGKIYLDSVTKDRFFVTGMQGDDIVKCTVISDVKCFGGIKYMRITEYSIEDHVYCIRQKATRNGVEVPLSEVSEWKNILPEIRIGNVKKLPIGIYKCPANGRTTEDLGVPITYGCDATMDKIKSCIDEIEKEYKNKSVKIFADSSLFDKDKKLSDLYVRLRPSGRADGSGIDVFDPSFRDSALYNRLEHLLAQLEKEVGTSRGILTDMNTSNATATEIRRASFQTFALCDEIRLRTEAYFKDVMYGVNVLCEALGLTPYGDYKIQFHWSYSLIEDSGETFRQMMEAFRIGAVTKAEIRRFVMGESQDGNLNVV